MDIYFVGLLTVFTMELIAKNKHLTCHFDAKNKVLHLIFEGVVNTDLTKEVTIKIIEFTRKNQVLGEFVDLSKMTGTFTHLIDYLTKEYYPKMLAQGMQCEGVVVSKDVFTKFAADTLIKKMGDFVMQTFQDRDQALQWVLENSKEKQ